MTDAEIIKALKELLEIMLCEGDLQRSATISKAIDLINRQKAEIERLKDNIEQVEESFIDVREMMVGYKVKLDTAKEQTAKDFAERVKTKFDRYGAEHYYYSIVDDALSEMGVDTND